MSDKLRPLRGIRILTHIGPHQMRLLSLMLTSLPGRGRVRGMWRKMGTVVWLDARIAVTPPGEGRPHAGG
jgi:hypothetical protein